MTTNMTTRLNYYKTASQIYPSEPTPIPTLSIHPSDASPSTEKFTTIEESDVNVFNFHEPAVFGPPMWKMYHNASLNYPDNASPLFAERMKYCILGMPILIPCKKCQEHATAFIEQHRHLLNTICSGRENLFKFFVDFHNTVNKRLGKPIYSYEEAYILYTGEVISV
jgi:Erv1 / Alr family